MLGWRAIRILLLVLVAGSAPIGDGTAASEFQLVFEGSHKPAAFASPTGLQHEGPFTTSGPFCRSGYARDVEISAESDSAVRAFTCAGSAGAFTAKVAGLVAEHGGSGSWQIVSGTGPLRDLRGKGTWSSVRVSGSSSDPASVTFHSTWTGAADFDVSPPTASFSGVSAKRLLRPAGMYVVRVVIALSDDKSSVSYRLALKDPRKPVDPLAVRKRDAATGTVRYALRVRPTKRTRLLKLELNVSDAVGNEGSAMATVRLRR
jgi:hypothetical protein